MNLSSQFNTIFSPLISHPNIAHIIFSRFSMTIWEGNFSLSTLFYFPREIIFISIRRSDRFSSIAALHVWLYMYVVISLFRSPTSSVIFLFAYVIYWINSLQFTWCYLIRWPMWVFEFFPWDWNFNFLNLWLLSCAASLSLPFYLFSPSLSSQVRPTVMSLAQFTVDVVKTWKFGELLQYDGSNEDLRWRVISCCT